MTKTKQEVTKLLWDCCRLNRTDWMEEIFAENPDEIDFSDSYYKVFNIAVQDNKEALLLLLDFYKKTKLNYPEDSRQYKIAYKDLQYVLRDADVFADSDEIRAILDPYLVGVDDSLSSSRDDIMEEEMDHGLILDDISDNTTKERSSDDSKDSDQHIKILPFTKGNLDVLGYPYWRLNIEAEESYNKGDITQAIDKITKAAMLVMNNPNTSAHQEHKVMVIYNYLRLLDHAGIGASPLLPEGKFNDYVHKALFLAEEVKDHEMSSRIHHFIGDEHAMPEVAVEEVSHKLDEMHIDAGLLGDTVT